MSSLSYLVAAAEESHRELPMPALAYGVLALVGFLILLGILWIFRGSANKVALAHAPGHADGHAPEGDHQGSQH